MDCTPGQRLGSFKLRPTKDGVRFEAGPDGLVLGSVAGAVDMGGAGPDLLSHYLRRKADGTCP